jgi:hypothetical protein
MKYAMIRECNITGGIAIEKFEADNIESAWRRAENEITKHEELMVVPLNDGNKKAIVDLLKQQPEGNHY